MRGYTQPHAVLNHLGIPSLAMARNPKNLTGEGNVMDVLDLEVRVPSVGVLHVEGFTEAFGHLRGSLLGYGDLMDGPSLEPGRPMVFSGRLNPRLEDNHLGKY